MNLCEAALQIRQALRDGNTAEAINVFRQTGEKQAPPLFEMYAEAQKQYACDLIGIEEWGRTQTRIYHSILGTDFMRVSEMPKSLSSEIKINILKLLHLRKTEQALTLCEGFSDQFLLLQAQLNAAKNQYNIGLIESEYYEATKSRLNDSLQALIEPITEPPPPKGLLNKILRRFM